MLGRATCVTVPPHGAPSHYPGLRLCRESVGSGCARGRSGRSGACTFDRLRLVTLRLAPVYGPNRGVRERIRKGDYRILDDGKHVTSRIHVDDLVAIVFAAEAKAVSKSRYLVADDEPTTQGEYAAFLCER